MIRAALPDFELKRIPDSPLPEAAVEAIAALLLDAIESEEGSDVRGSAAGDQNTAGQFDE